ncbi:putative hydrolase of the HAD superfamily [Micromonospora pallida]|uniref:Putative hydrolase of the HAD superfamily n=1 Tax=Micromonospora pallida TaxID=145854 RepID=A0A1C6TFD9_9ACTN|nr:HAD family hydrolase [Micromonospora pallida]SCL40175.1 putative hydrolase of the HAD superfamily [Micromonospora pallida]
MVSVVVFDADETLLNLRPAVTSSLLAVLAEMRRLSPAAAALSLADLEADCAAVWAADCTLPVEVIRRLGLVRSLARVGLDAEIDRVLDLFFAHRFALTRPFPDVLPALADLRRHFVLGYATNGNSRTERCGLAGEFTFELYAHENGLPKKPAPEFYAVVVAAAGVPASEVLYVGDNLDHDVVAAQAAGLRTVWVNRTGAQCRADVQPDAEVSTLAELLGVIDRSVRQPL